MSDPRVTRRYDARTITIGDRRANAAGTYSYDVFEGSVVIGMITRTDDGRYRAIDRTGRAHGLHARMSDAATAIAEQR